MNKAWEKSWKVINDLGQGGQGITCLVEAKDGSTPHAVLKRLKNRKSVQARQRMRREVVALETLSATEANVPAVFDHNTESFSEMTEELFVVMEFIDGPTLAEKVESAGHLDIESSFHIANSLCATFGIAHASNVLHRDLKPDNVVLKNDADAFVIDFGLSFNSFVEDELTQTEETFRNKFLDLPETVSPGGNRRDPRSDVTAICAVLYFSLERV